MLYMKFSNLEKFKGLVQIVSMRKDGMSKDPYATLNLAFHVGDDSDKVLLNREILCNQIGVALDCIVCAEQVHKSNVALVQKADWGKGSEDHESAFKDADAMITNKPELFLMVMVADCAAVVFYDPVKKAVGVAHAGWRSTLAGISSNVVAEMKKRFKSNPADIICGISPSIGPCCFEVGEEVISSFAKNGFGPERKAKKGSPPAAEKRGDKFFLNLWEINRIQLIEAGVKNENIEIARLCNCCHSSVLFSVRKDGKKTGRYAVLIGRRK